MTDAIFQMVFGLGFVIVLIFALSFFYRKRQKGSGLISLIAYQSLGQRIGVAAVKIDDEVLVLGITPTDFKLLKKIDGRTMPGAMTAPEGGPGLIAEKVRELRRLKEEIL